MVKRTDSSHLPKSQLPVATMAIGPRVWDRLVPIARMQTLHDLNRTASTSWLTELGGPLNCARLFRHFVRLDFGRQNFYFQKHFHEPDAIHHKYAIQAVSV
jgi:hypothetical protein